MNKIMKKQPPEIWGLFLFIFISILHLILLLNIITNINFLILVIVDLAFFVYYSRISIKIFLKIIYISGFIFLLNLFFSEGKILNDFGFFKITSEGVLNGLKKSGLIASTLFFTYNILKDNKYVIINYISRYKKNIILNSINYFFIFFELISEKTSIKRFVAKIILIYNNKYKKLNNEYDNNKITKDFYIYNSIFFMIYILVFIYSYIIV